MSNINSQTLSANGSTTAIELGSSGKVFVQVQGTWSGGTLTTYLSGDNGTTWSPVGPDAVFTADGWAYISVPMNAQIKNTLTGAGSPSLKVIINE